MAEPQPGRPGGSGAQSATAATFQVNDSSLRELRKTWQGLTSDVREFAKAVRELRGLDGDLDRIGNKVRVAGQQRGRAGGRSGNRAEGMPPVPEPRQASAADERGGGGAATGNGPAVGGSSGRARNGGDSRFSSGQMVAGAAAGAFAAGSTYYATRLGGISDNDLLYNQLGREQGGIYRHSRANAERQAIRDMGGYQSQADLAGGVRAITGTLGGTATTGRAAGVMQQAANMTSLAPDMGFTGAGQGVASLYSATSSNRLRTVGVGSMQPGGRPRDATAIYNDILRRVFRGRPFTAAQITEGMVPGAPLQRSLNYLLPDPNAQELFKRYALARASLARGPQGTNAANNADQATAAFGAAARMNEGEGVSSADRKLVRDAGLRDNIRSRQNRLSQQTVENESNLGEAGRDGIMAGLTGLAAATGVLTQGFLALNNALGDVPANAGGMGAVLGGPVGTLLGAFGGVGGAAMTYQTVRDMLGGRLGRPGGGGGGGGTAGTGGGAPGGPVQAVWVTNPCLRICGGGGVGAGSGAGAPDVDIDADPDGGRRGGRGRHRRPGRLGRLASRARGMGGLRAAGALGAGLAAFGGSDWLFDQLEDKAREDGTFSTGDRVGKSLGTIGKYALGGTTTGALFGGPVGAAVGAGVGTAVGLGKAIYDWGWGSNMGEQPGDSNTKAKGAPSEPRYGYFSPDAVGGGVPAMSKGGAVSGNHSRDDVAILATPGEVVVPNSIVSRHGGAKALMRKLGFSAPPLAGAGNGGAFAQGGEVDGWNLGPKNMVRITGGGKSLEVHQKAAGSFKGFLDELVAAGYDMKSVGGYNKRKIGGTDRWSNHAYGASIDIDPFDLGNGFDRGTKSKIGTGFKGDDWITALARKHGLGWGGEWSGRKDWMHFEAIGAPASSKRYGVGGALQAGSGDGLTDGQGATEGQEGHSGPTTNYGAGGSFKSELEALSSILSGSTGSIAALGAAVKSQTTQGGAAAPAPDTATTGATPGAPSSVSGNAKLGQSKAAARGWTGEEWSSLYQLWQKESGWDHTAANPSSSARGIPQAMMSAHFGKGWEKSAEAKAWLNNPGAQIDWGLNYIAGRYKVPSKAWAHSQKHNWYSKGALDVLQDEVAQLHAGEMVVPADQAKKLRSMIQQGRRAGLESGVAPGTPTSSHRTVSVSITAPITVVGKATQKDARDFLDMVKREAETEGTLDMIGAG